MILCLYHTYYIEIEQENTIIDTKHYIDENAFTRLIDYDLVDGVKLNIHFSRSFIREVSPISDIKTRSDITRERG